MTKKKKITVLITVLAIVLVGALTAVIIACNISNANEKSVNAPQTEASTVNVTEKGSNETTQSTVQTTTENNKTAQTTENKPTTTTPNKSAPTTSKSSSDSKSKKSSTTASSSSSKDKIKSSSSKKSTTSSKSTTKSETTKKTPYWCTDGGTHHEIDEGHGWYKSYKEAEQAAFNNSSSTTSRHYEIQECPCGLFTYYWGN